MKFHGKGVLTLSEESHLIGNFSEGKLNGSGVMNTENGMMEGTFKDGDLEGSGTIFIKEGNIISGRWDQEGSLKDIKKIV